MKPHEYLPFLRTVGFAANLPEPVLVALAVIAAPIARTAGTILQLEGDPAVAMYLVVHGYVKIFRTSSTGREQVLNVLGPGSHFNTVPIFDNGPCPANAQALTELDLLVLPRERMRHVVEQHPALALALLGEFTSRLRHLVNLVDDVALHTVHARLAGLLLSEAAAAERGEPVAALTQADMAARLGTVREMIGRALKSFEVQGLIRLDRGVITIVNPDGLAAEYGD